jgi:hypothetical protein
MVKKDEGSKFESSFNQNYIIWRNNGLFGMIESMTHRNPKLEHL